MQPIRTIEAEVVIEGRHRNRARVEDRIRDDKDSGLARLPFKDSRGTTDTERSRLAASGSQDAAAEAEGAEGSGLGIAKSLPSS
jgi:hypothetical protein